MKKAVMLRIDRELWAKAKIQQFLCGCPSFAAYLTHLIYADLARAQGPPPPPLLLGTLGAQGTQGATGTPWPTGPQGAQGAIYRPSAHERAKAYSEYLNTPQSTAKESHELPERPDDDG